MANPILAVGTAAFGGQVSQLYGASILKLQDACREREIDFHYMVQSGDALVQRARQQLITRFLETPAATHLLLVDADIGFEPEQFFRLLEFDRDFVAAVYPKKKLDILKLKNLIKQGHPNPEAAALDYDYEVQEGAAEAVEKGFVKARAVGAGFLLLKKTALVAMTQRYPELSYSGGFIAADPLAQSPWRYALFNCLKDEKTGVYLDEAVSFCRRWTQMGGDIWVDRNSRLDHVGPQVFSGDLTPRP